jgi:2-dehydropantoate 2-reductase
VIAVLGPGGVGGLVAAALDRAGEQVTVVARQETAAAIAASGLRVSSVVLGDFTARPAAVAELNDDVEALVVSTKAAGLPAALERIRAEPALVLPLLNGLDHMTLLRERFGARAVAGSIRVESDRPETGVIVHTSVFLRIELASADEAMAPAMRSLAARLAGAGIDAILERSEAQVLWAKLVRLNALAITTSASGLPLGDIRADPAWRARLEVAVEEASAVARAEGADVVASAVMAELEDAHASLSSSMARDIAAGREPELDAIPGAVLRAAARHGLRCPTISALVDEVVSLLY